MQTRLRRYSSADTEWLGGRKIEEDGYAMTLDEITIGKECRITSVGGAGELRLRLLDMGLIPKTVVRVQKVAPMGDPIEIHLRGYELTLRKEDAAQIEVTQI